MSLRFEIDRDERGRHGFRLVDDEDRGLLESKRYAEPDDASHALEALRASAGHFPCYEVCTSFGGDSYFLLKSIGGEILARSATFDSPAAAQTVLERVARDAARAEVVPTGAVGRAGV